MRLKYVIVLGDGMADWPIEELGGKTIIEVAHTPNMDLLARRGAMGLLQTVPQGFHPGSEVANSSILGYDQRIVYQGRGPLEAASIGVELESTDFAMRCNLVCLQGDQLKNHSCGRLETEEADVLIKYLNEHLANDRVRFYTGTQYRHLLVIKGGDSRVNCTPPHDIPLQPWRTHLPQAQCAEAEATAALLQELMLKSQELLAQHPLNIERQAYGQDPANSIWPWGGGYRPQMQTIPQRFPHVKSGAVITAVDLIRGIGHYAGLDIIRVPGATGLWDTNYEGKAQAAIDALRKHDFVYVHVEASDEAGHDGERDLKLQTVESLDQRLIAPILRALGCEAGTPTELAPLTLDGEPVAIAVLPDHPTPVAHRTHTAEPIPFLILRPDTTPDSTVAYSEAEGGKGSYGTLQGDEFINRFLNYELL